MEREDEFVRFVSRFNALKNQIFIFLGDDRTPFEVESKKLLADVSYLQAKFEDDPETLQILKDKEIELRDYNEKITKKRLRNISNVNQKRKPIPY
ncbi:hypothetical protein H7K32_21110 [Brevibacillus agri]|uniref:hypothetical protein n=1 Tax=Brevibacillus agri TaxID=51101 RepID=UPI0002A4EFE2|nr:hypothetical protein [Brevibacillus agri]ELK38909.1 hypothetical protein D478_27212 [Brevibacillus agri BAB-2500]MBY0054115.1 hypothetical protein [Brevibacillus agri]